MSSPDFRLKKIDETRNYILEEIKYNNLMIEKAQKEIKCLNYVEQLLVSVSAFTSSVPILLGATIVLQ